jgi:hypothetical protein
MALKKHEESSERPYDMASIVQSEQASTVRSRLTYSKWLRICIAANAVPVLAHICGGIAVDIVTVLATKRNGIWWCRWIDLVRFSLNLCHRTT